MAQLIVSRILMAASLLLSMLPISSYAVETPWNVVLITIDGVRFQEFFSRPGHTSRLPLRNRPQSGFPKLWERLKAKGDSSERLWVYGDPVENQRMEIANPYAISLPGYQGIFAGESQGSRCKNNSCNQITVETFPERLIREAAFPRNKVASISSWNGIARGIESKPGTITGNFGRQKISEPEMASVNEMQVSDASPWGAARFDKYTEAYALWYLKSITPRFLHIGLNDSDEYGHERNYKKYLASLRQYDEFFLRVIDALQGMGAYGRDTAVVLTTDHGRGRGPFWYDHSPEFQSAHRVFAVLRMPDDFPATAKKSERKVYSHLDLRPTIESLLGLLPLPSATGSLLYDFTSQSTTK